MVRKLIDRRLDRLLPLRKVFGGRFLIPSFLSLLFAFGLFSIMSVGAASNTNTAKKLQPNCNGELTPLQGALSYDSDLDFSIIEAGGKLQHRIKRVSRKAVHVQVNSTKQPSVIFAFANGGDSGGAVWFQKDPNMQLDIASNVTLLDDEDGMYGFETSVEATGVSQLTLEYDNVGSVRSIRNFDDYNTRTFGFEGKVELDTVNNEVRITRELTREHRYSMTLKAEVGSEFKRVDGKIVLLHAKGSTAPLRFRVAARSSEPLLTPMSAREVIKDQYIHLFDQKTLNQLSFLTYREKWMAGSHRYLTYFGRDTAVSAKMMLAFLKPEAVAGALAGLLDRVDKNGWVSHEETLADFAYYESGNNSFEAQQNKEHIDANYMLADLVTEYLSTISVEQGNAFLNRAAPDRRTYREVLASNMSLVMKHAERFAQHMSVARAKGDEQTLKEGWKDLVRFRWDKKKKQYFATGNWRDSLTGNGGGVIPYDVNCVLMPAALAAAYNLYNDTRYGLHDEHNATFAQSYYNVWTKESSEFFKVEIRKDNARKLGELFMSQESVNLRMPRAPLTENLKFYALSLKIKKGPEGLSYEQVKIMHSDVGQKLLYGYPTDEELITICDLFIRQAPYGLRTKIGPVVAMPAFADIATQQDFTKDAYHGFMVWGRELAIALIGMVQKQWPRRDIGIAARLKLQEAVRSMKQALDDTKPFRTTEAWTWVNDGNGHMVGIVYGSLPEHHTVANPIQLWSVALAAAEEYLTPMIDEILSMPVVQTAAAAN